MPAPGDQHKSNNATAANPFEDNKPQISEYTASEIATLQSRLNKRLGPEFISTRPGPGNQKVAYLSAEKAISLANEVFGFNGWSSSIQNIQIDFVDEVAGTGKVSLGLSVVVRVTLRDGTYHEDIGYGGIENCKGKVMAFEKSKKEATTDALKRALRSFGNVLGNCMYDKDFITKISKVKAGNGRFDVQELHRHPDFAPKTEGDAKQAPRPAAIASKTPSLEFEDSFDTSEFDDIDFTENDLTHPEEILLPADLDLRRSQMGTKGGMPTMNTPSKMPQPQPPAGPKNGQSRPLNQRPSSFGGPAIGPAGQAGLAANRAPLATATDVQRTEEQHLSSPGLPSQHFAPQQGQGPLLTGALMAPPVAGFYSAKAAKDVDPNSLGNLPPGTMRFNPQAESPSIRKTAGVDHTKSVPVRRELLKSEPAAVPNVVEPRGDANRRIGMPGPPMPGPIGRPGMSTSAYRPPTRQGSPAMAGPLAAAALPSNAADRILAAAKRPPLGDVSNFQHNVTATTADGADAKRQKVEPGGKPPTGSENAASPNANRVM